MMSAQLLTRNLRRFASLRGFSSASTSKKANLNIDKTDKINNKSEIKSTTSVNIFDKLKSLNQLSDTEIEPRKSVDKLNKDISHSGDLFGQQKAHEPPPATQTKTNKNERKSSMQSDSALSRSINESITKSQSVDELLILSEKNLNQKNAMEFLTKISALTAANQANVKDFQHDYRFLKICRILSKFPAVTNVMPQNIVKFQQKSTEMEMILSIAGDEEAIKLIQTLSLSQKVKVFSSLARKKTRNISVLKALAMNISSDDGQLNLKECSDLLFAMTTLNFIDEMLLCRIGIAIDAGLAKNRDKMAVVGSIVTSLGFLKYKEAKLLDNLSEWVIEKQEFCRPKDLASLILTLAFVNHRPKNADKLISKLIPKILQTDLSASEWLDYVWALTILELYQPNHLDSVLGSQFVQKLLQEQSTKDYLPAQKMKLMNINAVAKMCATKYNGPFIDSSSSISNYPFGYRKSKKIMLQGLLDTLKNLFTTDSYIRTEHDTKLGFFIDAECVLSENRTPLAIDTKEANAMKVAFMILDYHDMCRGCKNEPNGINTLAIKLLEKCGYKVLLIPHNEFSTSDKVLKRVQYLNSKLKDIVNQPTK